MNSAFHILDDFDEGEILTGTARFGVDRRTFVHLRELEALVDERRLEMAREIRARGEEEIDLDEIALCFG